MIEMRDGHLYVNGVKVQDDMDRIMEGNAGPDTWARVQGYYTYQLMQGTLNEKAVEDVLRALRRMDQTVGMYSGILDALRDMKP